MDRKRQGKSDIREASTGSAEVAPSRLPATTLEAAMANLRFVEEDRVNRMVPGDILLLDQARHLRAQVALAFVAVLACPRCGNLDLVTHPQFRGIASVMCGYSGCSCHFRIQDTSQVIYLPVN